MPFHISHLTNKFPNGLLQQTQRTFQIKLKNATFLKINFLLHAMFYFCAVFKYAPIFPFRYYMNFGKYLI